MSSPRVALAVGLLASASLAVAAVVLLTNGSDDAGGATAAGSQSGSSTIVALADAGGVDTTSAVSVDAWLEAPIAGPSAPPDAASNAICDEVSCVLSNYDGTCCDVYRTRRRPPPPTAPGCDEVSCVLDNYQKACCARFRAPTGRMPPPPSPDPNALPDSLDRMMILDGVNKVKPKIRACGDKFPSAKGNVKVRVKVDPDGDVTLAEIVATPDPGLGDCVRGELRRAKFRKTANGGTFSYPFMF